jgi:hypothetical protein
MNAMIKAKAKASRQCSMIVANNFSNMTLVYIFDLPFSPVALVWTTQNRQLSIPQLKSQDSRRLIWSHTVSKAD